MRLLTENLVLSIGGATLGLALAVLGLDLLVQYADRFTVRTGEIGIDLPVLGFTVGIAVLVAVLLAWAPSLPGLGGLGSTRNAASSGRGALGLPRKQVQRLLVISQRSLSFTLLIGAGLMVRSLVNLTRLETGIDFESVVAMEAPNTTGMPAVENLVLMDQVIDELRYFPGVRTVAHASRSPWDSNATIRPRTFRVEGEDDEGVSSPMTDRIVVSPQYFQTVGVPIRAGRGFMPSDDAESDSVAIVNERMAQDLFGQKDPLNRRISLQTFNGAWGPWMRIVGVAADTREFGGSVAGTHTLYRPAAQGFAGGTVLVNTVGGPGPLARRAAEIVAGLDADRPVDRINTLSDLRANDLAPERLNATLFGAFALLALMIAAVGVLGVLAFTVSQRTQEFGVRMALGAEQTQVLRMVMREGVGLAVGALLVGGVAAAFLSRFLEGLLFGVTALDPMTYGSVGAVLALVSLTAAWFPARRATRVDPMVALRSE